MPGRLIDAIKRAKAKNAVLLLDEVDKMTHGVHGNPAAALLEVLDYEQNSAFVDQCVASWLCKTLTSCYHSVISTYRSIYRMCYSLLQPTMHQTFLHHYSIAWNSFTLPDILSTRRCATLSNDDHSPDVDRHRTTPSATTTIGRTWPQSNTDAIRQRGFHND